MGGSWPDAVMVAIVGFVSIAGIFAGTGIARRHGPAEAADKARAKCADDMRTLARNLQTDGQQLTAEQIGLILGFFANAWSPRPWAANPTPPPPAADHE